MAEILRQGTRAPDFTAPVTPDQKLSLSDFAGRRVILAFYPADWSPVCGDQMTLYNLALPQFRELGAELLGISVDGPWCHQAYARQNNIHFPLVADFHPKGGIAKAYGAYRDPVPHRAHAPANEHEDQSLDRHRRVIAGLVARPPAPLHLTVYPAEVSRLGGLSN